MIRRLGMVVLLGLLATLAEELRAEASCSPMDVSPSGPQGEDELACCDGSGTDDGCGPPKLCPSGEESGTSSNAQGNTSRSVGSPVDPMTGFMWVTEPDLEADVAVGPPIAFQRSYASAWAQTHGGRDMIGPLGPGWSHTYASRLEPDGSTPPSTVTYRRADTGSEVFTLSPSGEYTATEPGRILRLDAATSLFTLQWPGGDQEVYEAQGRLRVLRSHDGGEAHLVYVDEDTACAANAARPPGQLCRVDFLNGQQLWFSYGGSPLRLTQVSWDAIGASPVVALGYDPSGYLTTATLADGSVTRYTYGFTHKFYAFPGQTVNLLTEVDDGDGVLREAFAYVQNSLTPSRVAHHTTPDDQYSMLYGHWSDADPRHATVSSAATNFNLTWARGRIASTCYPDDKGQYDAARCSEQVIAPTGPNWVECFVDTQGRATVFGRDSLGRKTSVIPGVALCSSVTSAERQHETHMGYVGDTNRRAFESWVSVDPSAPAGFRSSMIWDHADPAVATDPYCGTAACQDPSAYNQPAALTPLVHQAVHFGRTFSDLSGAWAIQAQVVRYTYGPSNELVGISGPRTDLDDSVTLAYFPNSTPGPGAERLHTVSRGAHTIARYEDYTTLGKPQTIYDENGQPTHITYDQVGRLQTVLGPDGNTATFSYLPSGRLKTVALPKGNSLLYQYDAVSGLLASVQRLDATSAVTEEIDYAHDVPSSSLVTRETYSVSSGAGRSVQYQYDPQGRRQISAVNRPGSSGIRYTHFDEEGAIDWVTDEGHASAALQPPTFPSFQDLRNEQYLYDALGRLAEFQKLVNGRWEVQARFGYDLRDNITQVYDPTGLLTTYVYDDFGRLVEVHSPDSGLRRYVYDEAGNVLAELLPDGTTLSRTYDERNRLLSLAAPGLSETYLHDGATAQAMTDCADGTPLAPSNGAGQLTGVVDGSGAWMFGYTEAGLIAFEAHQAPGAGCARTFRYSYDANRNLASLRYPSGHRLDYAYPDPAAGGSGDLDRPVGLTLVAGGTSTQLASSVQIVGGSLAAWTAGNGLNWSLERAQDGSPTTLEVDKNGSQVRRRRFGLTDDAGNYNDLVDPAGNLVSMEEDDPNRSQRFSYDLDHDFLAGATGPYGSQRFQFENGGDRLNANDAGYCYEQGTHRLVQVGGTLITYGPSGAAWVIESDAGTTTLCSDAKDQVRAFVGPGGEVWGERYDFRHQRAAEVSPVNGQLTEYLYGRRGQLLMESDYGSLANPYPRPTFEYVYLADQPIAVVRTQEFADGGYSAPEVTYLFGGHMGEPFVEADQLGDVIREFDFAPFGKRLEVSSQTVQVGQAVSNQTGSFSTTLSVPGARSVALHLSGYAPGSCPAIELQDGSSTVAGFVGGAQGQDFWTGEVPGDTVSVVQNGCATPYSFTIAEIRGSFGAARAEALALQPPSPYPAQGQHFTLDLGTGSFVSVTGISTASCDVVEARDHTTGQHLWTAPAGWSQTWTPLLSGQVDLGIWGQGCNATEQAAGFVISSTLSFVPTQPNRLGFPGHVGQDGSAEILANRFRQYHPELGRYLEPDPLLTAPNYVRAAAQSGQAVSAYAYAGDNPVNTVDPTGLLTLDIGSAKSCSSSMMNKWVAAYDAAQKMAKSSRCAKAFKDSFNVELQDLLDYAQEGPTVHFGPTRDFNVHGQQQGSEITLNCYLYRTVDEIDDMAATLIHELGHYADGDFSWSNFAELDPTDVGEICKEEYRAQLPNACVGCNRLSSGVSPARRKSQASDTDWWR